MKTQWRRRFAGVQGLQAFSGVRRRLLAAFAVVVLGVGIAPRVEAHDWRDWRDDDRHWVGTWGASPQSTDAFTVPTPASFSGQTVRQIVHTSIGGNRVRVRLTNELGTSDLVIGAAHVALQSSGSSIVAGSDRTLTFGGRTSVTIPKGAPMLSDPVDLPVPALGNVVISLYLPNATPTGTVHALGRQTTYISASGDSTGVITFPTATTTESWYFLSALEVYAQPRSVAIVTLGDSITDGFASTVNANRRWPNILAERLQASRRYAHLAVIDEGISGNRLLHDAIGPNALSRIDRDVLAQSGAKYVTLLIGINDIGFSVFLPAEEVSAADIIAAYKQIIARVHAQGLLIYGATLTPFDGAGYFSAAGEAKRQAVNQWIRYGGGFDGLIDFDRAVRDPAQPSRMRAAYDSGDHLHPNDAGYRAMAESIDLRLFTRDSD